MCNTTIIIIIIIIIITIIIIIVIIIIIIAAVVVVVVVNSNFTCGFAGSPRDWRTGLDPVPSGADSAHVSGCTPQLEFDAATSISTNGRIPISEGLQAACLCK